MSTTLDITTLINLAESAASGMSDYQNVEGHEDARTAATEIVAYHERESGLLGQREADRFAEIGGTDGDMDEIRGRCVDIIERAILTDRAAVADKVAK